MDEPKEEIAEKDGLLSKDKGAPLLRILKYSDWIDVWFMTLGTIGCIAEGSSLALTTLVTSKVMNSYSDASLTLEDIDKCALTLLYIAVGVGLGGFLEGFCWARTAERQASRLRSRYLQAVLSQDVSFFDGEHP